jgi:hypothetical protein
MAGWEQRLRLARARRNLAERALRETVNRAVVEDGITAKDVARALRIAQSDAERLLGALEHAREPDGRLPGDAYGVAERYAVGELSREDLRATLGAWDYAPRRVMADYWDDVGVTREGSFGDTVGRAFDDGLIDGDDYDAILAAYQSRA